VTPQEQEAFLMQRMRQLDAKHWDIFAGDTTTVIRRERARRAITEAGLAQSIAGKTKDGKSETFASLFGRVYGSPFTEQPEEKPHA